MTQTKIVFRQSLNTSGTTLRVRQLEWECKRLRKGIHDIGMTNEEINAFIEKPITKSERLRMYANSGRYRNNKTPKR